METFLTITLILAGAYVGWNIGANDAANCIGTTVGSGIISFRKAAILMGIFVTLGGVFQGHHVMKTVGKGIIVTSPESYQELHGEPAPAEMEEFFPDDRLPDLAIFIALISAGLFVTLATFSSIPVSTSQAIVGGVAGVGLGIVGIQASYIKISVLLKILSCWVISPVLTLIIAFVLYKLISAFLRGAKQVLWTNLLGILMILSACYVSYSLGANDVGNAIGPLLNKFPDKGMHLALMGGAAMAVGALTFGRRVVDTVGKNITQLNLAGAFSSQVAAAIGVHLFSVLGIPVSTSQAIVGAVIGVGLTHGTEAVSRKKILVIVTGWILAPTCAAIFAIVAYRVAVFILD